MNSASHQDYINLDQLKDWLDRILVTIAIASVILGSAVLIGWHTSNLRLIRVLPAFAPMHYNAALSFILCGAALLALVEGKKTLAAIIAAFPLALGLVTIIQYVSGNSWGIGELFTNLFPSVRALSPGTMAPNTALGFLLIGSALVLMSRFPGKTVPTLLFASLGSITLGMTVVAILGYIFELPSAFGWFNFPGMSLHAAVGLSILGLGVMTFALRKTWKHRIGVPQWLPAPIWVGTATITLLLWQALVAQDSAQLHNLTQSEFYLAKTEAESRIDSKIQALERIAKRMNTSLIDEEKWRLDAQLLLNDFVGLKTVAWLDNSLNIHLAIPERLAERNDAALQQHQRSLIQFAPGETTSLTFSDQILRARNAFISLTPIYQNGALIGFIGGLFDAETLLNNTFIDIPRDYTISVSQNGKTIYTRQTASGTDMEGWATKGEVALYGSSWLLEVAPTQAVLDRHKSVLPELTLIIGFLMASLLAWMVHLRHTARERALESEEAKARFYGILDIADDAIISVDQEQRIILFNKAAERIFGFSQREILFRPLNILLPGISSTDSKQAQTALDAPIAAEANRPEVLGRRADGTQFIGEISVSELKLKNDIVSTIILRDITERKAFEDKLTESRDFYFRLFSDLPYMTWRADPNGECDYFNQSWLNFTGRTLEQELGQGWVEGIYADDVDYCMKTYSEALAKREPFEMEYRLRRHDGEYRWIRNIGKPIYGMDKEFIGFIGSCQDITERKELEETRRRAYDELEKRVQERTLALSQANEELQREVQVRTKIEKLLAVHAKDLERSNADLERFAYVASHDLQEPLRMVSSYTQLVARRYKDKLGPEAGEFIGYIVDGSTRMQQLINDLLAYSRVGTRGKEFVPFSMEKALEDALANLKIAINENQVNVTHDVLPMVFGDDTQISRVFQNLIGNAIKFRRQDNPSVHISAQSKDDEWVFSVRDNGIGLEAQYAERIFLIFQRLHTKAEYPGTGIGLAICKRIIERHGGRIWVESQPNQGSCFYFTLPSVNLGNKTANEH